jgi:hypothetical protein
VRIPAGLVVPEPDAARALLASLPSRRHRPAWWRGRAVRRDASVAVSPGAVGLNSQALALLRGAEAARASCLVVVAPHVSDEALATLLVNDALGVFRGGILPLRLLVPEFHVEEALAWTARALGSELWDGRARVPLARVAGVEAGPAAATLRLAHPSGAARLRVWLAAALGRP